MSDIVTLRRITVDYWGGCPQCGQHDGCFSVERDHWYVCHAHRVKWCIGSNLFSVWRVLSADDFARNAAMLAGFRCVEPLGAGIRLIRKPRRGGHGD
jgi:hypothetical protein